MPEEDRPVPPIVVKKYANRRLYDTESSIYITLDTLADMVRQGRDFVVYDAKTGDDITRAVLTQIIMEEETRGRNMLPTAFLRQLIGFYGDSKQGLVPDYLERMMDQFAAEQRPMQHFLPPPGEEPTRPNLTMVDRAMSLFSPFLRPGSVESPAEIDAASHRESEEVTALREELVRLRQEVARLSASLDEAELAEPVVTRVIHGGVRH